jgi:hypothetical protein
MKVSIIPLIINPARGGWWLSPTPLKNMSSSVGMMKFPIYGKIKNVPNHQPEGF